MSDSSVHASSGALRGRPAWILSDGRAAHEALSLGVARALGMCIELKRVEPTAIGQLTAPWGPALGFARACASGGVFAPPWPAVAVAAGRQTIPFIRALHRRAGLKTFTVVLMDPRVLGPVADLICVPEHDRRRGANVMTTTAAPHGFDAVRLEELRRSKPPSAIAGLPQPRIAMLLGGPNRIYSYTAGDIAKLMDIAKGVADRGAGLMITPSPRTPPSLAAAMSQIADRSNVYVWDGTGDNPYPYFLAHADRLIVTADSVSMVSEAAATGRPVYLFSPSGTGGKFGQFHARLMQLGVVRPLSQGDVIADDWTYVPIHAAAEIAAEIERRWWARHGFSGPMQDLPV